MKNTEPKWRVEKESCREHVVTDGVSEFRCGQEEANWLCGVLNGVREFVRSSQSAFPMMGKAMAEGD